MSRHAHDHVEVGVTYWPASVGPYMWHEFPADAIRRDLAAIAARRVPVVRVLLSWDAFMPTDRAPNPRRMRELEMLLGAARDLGLGVVLTLFAQTVGDCVMLPAYAVDRRAPRRGVRCVTDARVVDGGPRDIYTDPLMLEVQVRWLDAMLTAFAGHPAILAWDLGHDPATTIRPRRIADITAWVGLLATRVHAADEECRLTLGQADVVRGRGVRLAAMAAHVDALGLIIQPQRLVLPGDPLDPGRAVFTVDLAQALTVSGAPLLVEVDVASGDLLQREPSDPGVEDRVTSAPRDALRATDQVLQRLITSGVAGVCAGAWSDWGERLADAPPADRRPWLSRRGLVDSTGVSKSIAEAWDALAGRDQALAARAPYPATIDVESYYANLPDSLLDVYASWNAERGDAPAILD